MSEKLTHFLPTEEIGGGSTLPSKATPNKRGARFNVADFSEFSDEQNGVEQHDFSSSESMFKIPGEEVPVIPAIDPEEAGRDKAAAEAAKPAEIDAARAAMDALYANYENAPQTQESPATPAAEQPESYADALRAFEDPSIVGAYYKHKPSKASKTPEARAVTAAPEKPADNAREELDNQYFMREFAKAQAQEKAKTPDEKWAERDAEVAHIDNPAAKKKFRETPEEKLAYRGQQVERTEAWRADKKNKLKRFGRGALRAVGAVLKSPVTAARKLDEWAIRQEQVNSVKAREMAEYKAKNKADKHALKAERRERKGKMLVAIEDAKHDIRKNK